jgi:hypothetical protein
MTNRPRISVSVAASAFSACAFLLTLALPTLARAQTTTTTTDTTSTTTQTTTTATPTPDQVNTGTATSAEGVTKLPPFEVQSSAHDIGYYTQNTTMGTRLNSNLGDLGSSITVISKQQMQDTSSVNINDMFLYEASTEGTENFTSVGASSKGAGFSDNIQASPQTSNRVRGLGSVDITRDYFITNPVIQTDTYNVDDVELSRGPNSTLFGIGSASGILNESIEKAVLDKDTNEIGARYGSFGDFRATMNFNRALIPDKLAIAVAGLYANAHPTGEEPEYDIQRREFAAVTIKPFPTTTVRANIEEYDNPNRRADSFTPVDEVTPWLKGGSPTWDPITYTATVKGVTTAPITNAYNMPEGLYAATVGNASIGYPSFYVVHGQVQLWEQQELGTNFNSPGTPTATNSGAFGPIGREFVAASEGDYTKFASAGPVGVLTYPIFKDPGISNKQLLNWNGINLLAPNSGEVKAEIYNVEIEQQVTDNLFLEAGWYREQSNNFRRQYLNSNNGNVVQIDPNTRFLNGTPNPYFGDSYMPMQQGSDSTAVGLNEQERVAAVYTLDFTKNNNWTKWLGHHTLQAFYQHRENDTTNLQQTLEVLDAHSWNSTTDIGIGGTGAPGSINTRFYTSSNHGAAVTFDDGSFPITNFTYPVTWYNTQLNGGTWTNEVAKLGGTVVRPGNESNNQQQVWSYSGSMQNYLLNDRLVLTLGQRHDYERARINTSLGVDTSTGLVDTTNLYHWNNWTLADGITRQAGGVLHLTKWLSVHYNQSQNFTVTSLGEDEFGNVLPLPTGQGKDYGASVSFFDDKLVAEMNWYKSSTDNAHGSPPNVADRALRIDYSMMVYWAQEIATNNLGAAASGSAINTYAQTVVKFPTGLGQLWNATANESDTQTVKSNGWEFNLIYNPLRNWTMKVSADTNRAVDTNVFPGIQAYLASRLPVWTTATDPVLGPFWTTVDAGNVGNDNGLSPQAYLNSQVDAAGLDTALALQGQRQPDLSRYHFNYLTNYQFVTGRLTGFGLGTALRYETSPIIGYGAGAPDPTAGGAIDSLNLQQAFFGKELLHQDAWVSYKTRLPFLDKRIRMTIQLNVRDMWSQGYLQTVAVNPDGSPYIYRIIPPRQWYLQTTFDF